MSNQTPVVASEAPPNVTSGALQSVPKVEGAAERNMRSDSGSVVEDSAGSESESMESRPPSPIVEWNGDPMDWKSWPHGRPGPYVSKTAMRRAKECFRSVEKGRDEWSRTEEKVFHIADFSITGKGWLLLLLCICIAF
jgi:hypothetical protein